MSHTFIRREIHGLEELGYEIVRVGIRRGAALPDPQDQAEALISKYLVDGLSLRWLGQVLTGIFLSRRGLLRGLVGAWRLWGSSSRGFVKHMGYFVEALVLRSVMEDEKASHVHVHFGNNAAAVALLNYLMGGPSYSLTIHGPDEFDSPEGFRLDLKVKHARFVAVISNYCSSQVRRWIPQDQWERLHIVHCTVGSEWLEDVQPVSEGMVDIVCVGRLVPNKGQLILIDAFARAVRSGIEGNLILVGDGPMRNQLETYSESLGMRNRVQFMGWCSSDTIRSIIAKSRGFVLASFAEGLPVVLMESLALRRPVIATYIAGIPELVVPNVNGWLVFPADVDSLANAIRELSRAPIQLLRSFGENGRNMVLEQHVTRREAEKLSDLFETYLAG